VIHDFIRRFTDVVEISESHSKFYNTEKSLPLILQSEFIANSHGSDPY